MMTKTIYNYHPKTGEFLGEVPADASPLEPGVILVPAFATTIAPPQSGAREVAVFVDGQWNLLADYRAVKLFRVADGQPVSIVDVGVLPPPEVTEIPPVGVDYSWDGKAWVIDASKVAGRLEDIKASAVDRICASIAARRRALAAPADDAEIAGWQNKARIARAVLDNTATASEVDVLMVEMQVRAVAGETLSQFAQRIIDKSNAFAKESGQLDGIKRQLLSKVSDASTEGGVEAVLASLEVVN